MITTAVCGYLLATGQLSVGTDILILTALFDIFCCESIGGK